MDKLDFPAKEPKRSHVKDELDLIKEMFRQGLNRQFSGCVLEAHDLYKQGIEKLQAIIDNKKQPLKGEMLKKWTMHLHHFEEHMEKLSDQLHGHIKHSKLINQIVIKADSVGHSYQNLFGRYLTSAVKDILIFEPELSKGFHIRNLVNFLELVLKSCPRLRCVRLITKQNGRLPTTQLNILNQICLDMGKKNINFSHRFQENLEDAKILLSNGILISTGHGLHIYQSDYTQYSPGLCDFDFRKCLKCIVYIWKCKPFAQGFESAFNNINEVPKITKKSTK